MKKLIFLACLLPGLAFGIPTYVANQTHQPVNLLPNGGFELGLAKWTKSGAGATFTAETTAPLFDTKSAKFNASAASDYIQSNLYSVPTGLALGNCLANVYFKGGDANLKVQVLDNSANVLAERTLEGASTDVTPFPVSFICPATTASVRVKIIASADAAEITIDRIHLGENFNVYDATTLSSDWTTYTLTIGADTTPPTPGSDAVSKALWRRVGDSMEISFDYYQTIAGSAGTGTYLFPLPAGYTIDTNKIAIIANSSANRVVGSAMGRGSLSLTGSVRIASSTQLYLELGNEASTPSLVGSTFAGLANAIMRYSFTALVPISGWTVGHRQAMSPDTSGWYVDANIGGANPGLPGSSVSSFTEITDASLDLVVNPGSISAQIPCASGTASSGTTCTAANESIGVVFNLPKAGTVEACFDFSVAYVVAGAASDQIITTYEIIETTNTSSGIVQEGKGRLQSGSLQQSTYRVQPYYPHRLCGIFVFSSAGQKTLRMQYEQQIVGTPGNAVIFGDRSGGYGQRDIHVTVKPINQQVPAPLLVNSVQSAYSGVSKIDWARVTTTCSSTPCTIATSSGSWLSSIAWNSTGYYTVNFSAGYYSAPPACFVLSTVNEVGLSAATTTSVFSFQTYNSSGTASNSYFNIMCIGPR